MSVSFTPLIAPATSSSTDIRKLAGPWADADETKHNTAVTAVTYRDSLCIHSSTPKSKDVNGRFIWRPEYVAPRHREERGICLLSRRRTEPHSDCQNRRCPGDQSAVPGPGCSV